MGPLIFSAAIVAAIVSIIWRKRKQREKESRYHRRPGHQPETAWLVTSRQALKPRIKRERCHCGGPLWDREYTALVDDPSIQVASCECMLCEEKVRIYFRVEYLN